METNHNIYSIFAEAAERHPDKTAVFYLGTRFSYRKLQNLSAVSYTHLTLPTILLV